MSVISMPQRTYLNLVDAKLPVPPVMTSVLFLKASVILFIVGPHLVIFSGLNYFNLKV